MDLYVYNKSMLIPIREETHVDVATIGEALPASQPTLNIVAHSDNIDGWLRDNLVGGPSIAFNRYQEAGETPIRANV